MQWKSALYDQGAGQNLRWADTVIATILLCRLMSSSSRWGFWPLGTTGLNGTFCIHFPSSLASLAAPSFLFIPPCVLCKHQMQSVISISHLASALLAGVRGMIKGLTATVELTSVLTPATRTAATLIQDGVFTACLLTLLSLTADCAKLK